MKKSKVDLIVETIFQKIHKEEESGRIVTNIFLGSEEYFCLLRNNNKLINISIDLKKGKVYFSNIPMYSVNVISMIEVSCLS